MIAHHYTPVERALIAHQLADKRELYPPTKVRCGASQTCMSVSANGVTTIFHAHKVRGVWHFKAAGGFA